jgi:hypothetical protein
MSKKSLDIKLKERKEFVFDFSINPIDSERRPTGNVRRTSTEIWYELVTWTPQIRAFSGSVDIKWERI